MKSRIYYIIFFLIIFISAFCGLIVYKYNAKKVMLGSYVFANAIQDMDSLTNVSIKRGEREIHLELKDGLWRVKEADDYYANFALLNGLFTDVYNSQYISQIENVEDELFANSVSLEFKDANGGVLDNIVIGGKDKNRLYNFAKRKGDVFQITGKFVLPPDILSWMQNPSLRFEEVDVLSLQVVKKNGGFKEIELSQLPLEFWDYFGFMHFNNAVNEANFDKISSGEIRLFVITSTDGLKVEFSIFPKKNVFIGNIILRTTKMPTKEVNEYVKNNSFLYDDWYFELPQDYGNMIYKFFGEAM